MNIFSTLLVALLVVLMDSFILLIGNSAVLFYKRNGLPLMLISCIVIPIMPFLAHSILNKIRYDIPMSNAFDGMILVIAGPILFGLAVVLLYWRFLTKRLGTKNLNEVLKPCEWRFVVLLAILLVAGFFVVMLPLR